MLQTSKSFTWLQFAVFPVFYVVMYYVYFQIPDETFKAIYHNGIGLFCATLINFFAPLERVISSENTLISSTANLEIIRGCDGAGALFLIASAILAYPVKFKRKFFGLCLGVSMMYLINLIRICVLYFVIAHRPEWFSFIHVYLFPSLMVILGSLFFIWWVFSLPKNGHEPA